ncbi:LuxR C-terminal-related transcriptional regulator [Solwaraspora sp. WMMD1047]|uniref:response regulator transcription factor n=1 Tax=Solwaraspora sp. WMMD1047 TaxID=3016102 RepID=UPI00241610E1|nr:LuxR C-terminal-related transcriptional regulator [Solwaraspora sp. WMMD1047]MDG4828529.1 LuxR C-terminal-related transcriptional regulator [Solwaraspora sp. WMMD1047]
MRTVLVCVRTPIAAQSVAAVAARLGLSGAVRTAVSEPEAMARLGERAADVVLADTGVTRPDTVGFTRRVLARSPGAAVLLIGTEDPGVANAAVAAGARGLVQSGERDLVGAIAKAIMLLSVPRRPSTGPSPGATRQPPPAGRTSPATGRTPLGAGSPGTPGSPGPAGGPVGATPGAGAGRIGPAGADGGDPPSVVPVQRGDDAPAGEPAAETRGRPANEPAPVNRGPEPRSTRPPLSPPGSAAGYPTSLDPRANVAADARFGGPRRGVPAKPGGYALPAPAGAGPTRRVTLTEREMQVLVGMAEGKSNAEIGRELFVSEDTVKTHARRLFRKLGARDRAHAVAAGFRAGLVA